MTNAFVQNIGDGICHNRNGSDGYEVKVLTDYFRRDFCFGTALGSGLHGCPRDGGLFCLVTAPNAYECIGQALFENATVAVAGAEAENETLMVILGF